ncbi:MAG: hypothetical protein JWR18_2264, partial [Segetibacter sp.]|nr:hypothetical protein [Segetibacter sp.]
MNTSFRSVFFVLTFFFTCASSVLAQQAVAPVVTTADYQRAEKMLVYNTSP